MNLYVWENVLRDHTPGIMFAIADSPDQARSVILEAASNVFTSMEEDLKSEPDCYPMTGSAKGFYVWGGG